MYVKPIFNFKTEVKLQNKLDRRFRNELLMAGFKNLAIVEPVIQYCEWQFTQINVHPRELTFSKRANHLQSSNNSDLQTLFAKIRRGDDINEHLTRGLRDRGKHDNLYQAFGISHLHLRPTRSNELVLVAIDQDRCHVINVVNHGQWWEAFKTSIEVMHDEWPTHCHTGLGENSPLRRFASMSSVSNPTNTLEQAYQYMRNGIVSPIPFNDGGVGCCHITKQGVAYEVAGVAMWLKKFVIDQARAIDVHYPNQIPPQTMHLEQLLPIATAIGAAEDYFISRAVHGIHQVMRR